MQCRKLSISGLVTVLSLASASLIQAQPRLIAGVGQHSHEGQRAILAGIYTPVIGAAEVGADLRYLLGKELSNGTETALIANINARFPVKDIGFARVLVLGGLNYYEWRWTSDYLGLTYEEKGRETGLNIGAALEFTYRGIGIGAEAKAVANGGSSPFVLAVFLTRILR